MTRTLSAIAIAALASGAAAAQDRPANKITVTGCVERADQVLSRDTLGTTVDSQTYVLIRAKQGAADATRPDAAPQDTPDATPGLIYRLEIEDDAIDSHVGHRVEIVGSTPDAPVGTSGSAGESSPPIMLHVDSVKMLSSTCPRS
jgi:hypothetical protein